MTTRDLTMAMWLLFLLFMCRVAGQLIVYLFAVDWLPPFDHWYSGLLAYRYLLPAQCVILALMIWINIDVARGQGFFHAPRRNITTTLQWFSYLYAGSMVIRYAVTMSLYPERRWLGEGTIPVMFHLVLALYLYLYATHASRVR